jgi:hypothetical protein
VTLAEQAVLFLDLGELVDGARPEPFALRPLVVGVFSAVGGRG